MADETQNLVRTEVPEQTVVEPGERQARTVTCDKKTAMPILSVFVALLIASQAVSVYFITQQQSTISHLSDTTTALKLKDMMKNLPGSPPINNRQKLRITPFNIPLAFSDTDGSSQNLQAIAEKSQKIEDAVKFMLLRTNPLRTYPSLNGTILENLKKLKKSLNDQDWMVFDAWMQQWYLFYLVQHTETIKTTTAPTGTRDLPKPWKKDHRPAGDSSSGNLVYASPIYFTDPEPFVAESPSGAPVISECMEKASVAHALPGEFVPQCDEKGDYKAKQCWRSTGYCWCAYKNGTEIAGTRSRAKIDCKDLEDEFMEYDLKYSPVSLDIALGPMDADENRV